MAGNERRTSPRKVCELPLRCRVSPNGHDNQAEGVDGDRNVPAASVALRGTEFAGKALNLSERGVYFTCREKLNIGQPIEMYFSLPQELTGRAPENVRCSARVVHVDEEGQAGLRGIGACVERFEPVAAARNWAN
ncbi:MAG: PilZ domain-containing protein [Candidatus Acidiferrales bacterium]